jgi:metal iron transporter
VASQVALSMALPFVLVPLLVITSSKTWMTVREARNVGEAEAAAEQAGIKADEPATPAAVKPETPGTPGAVLLPYVSSPPPLPPADAEAQERVGRFASPWPVVLLCWLIYALIVLCDGFVVVTSAMGKS